MHAPAEQEIEDIRTLLRTPTPQNYSLAEKKLGLLASYLLSVEKALAAGKSSDSQVQKFLTKLPAEISAIRTLMETPLEFFRGLNAMRASRFGSYEHTGTLRNFQFEITSKTLILL